MMCWQIVLSVVVWTTAVTAMPFEKCNQALGMKSGAIADSAITATSSYYTNNLLPSMARLDGPSGWCPKSVTDSSKSEYIEIDLKDTYTITAIDTQGRWASSMAAEYADSFAIEYQRMDSYGWVAYVDENRRSDFAANRNAYKIVRNYMQPAIRTRRIKIYPLASSARLVCLRLELYGCLETVNEIIINAPAKVKTVEKASERCNTSMELDNNNPPSKSVSWCSNSPVYYDMAEWIALDFGNLRRVTAIETQGWYDVGRQYDYAEAYFVHYQTINSDRWIQYKDRADNSLLRGSRDPYTAVKNILDPALIAKRMRIIPYDASGRRVCFTVLLYGCVWRQALLSYAMPQGHRFGCADMGSPYYLYDFTYNGAEENEKLSGGLGQLTDNVEGLSDFTVDSGHGKQGYEWIGWSNETLAGAPVEIVFEFDSVRDFTRLSFHANNMVSRRVLVFRRAVVHFSVGGQTYQDDVVEYNVERDVTNEQTRTVSINIVGRVGRFVKVQLHLDAAWMMLSEVTFDSVANREDNIFLNYM